VTVSAVTLALAAVEQGLAAARAALARRDTDGVVTALEELAADAREGREMAIRERWAREDRAACMCADGERCAACQLAASMSFQDPRP